MPSVTGRGAVEPWSVALTPSTIPRIDEAEQCVKKNWTERPLWSSLAGWRGPANGRFPRLGDRQRAGSGQRQQIALLSPSSCATVARVSAPPDPATARDIWRALRNE